MTTHLIISTNYKRGVEFVTGMPGWKKHPSLNRWVLMPNGRTARIIISARQLKNVQQDTVLYIDPRASGALVTRCNTLFRDGKAGIYANQ